MEELKKVLQEFDSNKSDLNKSDKGKALIKLANILTSLDYKKECEHNIEDVCAYFDDNLDTKEKDLIEERIFSCDSCFKAYSFLVENHKKITSINVPQELINKVVDTNEPTNIKEKSKKHIFNSFFKNYYFSAAVAGITILFVVFPLSQLRKDVEMEINTSDPTIQDKILREKKSPMSQPQNSDESFQSEPKVNAPSFDGNIIKQEKKVLSKQKMDIKSSPKKSDISVSKPSRKLNTTNSNKNTFIEKKQQELVYDLPESRDESKVYSNKNEFFNKKIEKKEDSKELDTSKNNIQLGSSGVEKPSNSTEGLQPKEEVKLDDLKTESNYKSKDKLSDVDSNVSDIMAKRSVAKPPAPASMSMPAIAPKPAMEKEENTPNIVREIKIPTFKLENNGFILVYQNNNLIKTEKLIKGNYLDYHLNINTNEKVIVKIFEDKNTNNIFDKEDTLIRELSL